ncbi:UDP-glucose 4-epimerase GalE [Porticoccus sp. W117]|uniref:UDP-glucose 4-epimerase GalE n=1 Tax=Porticoccus sp. W117 TaxID=3054777 RepID=UPI0025971BD5|nr:UDP-glucose 4-epimerase GalE [Porticoccus sp. W117]MDM3871955.1 UDP-glucose 4-epimerase GalE [Porticoccus sp. W117]
MKILVTGGLGYIGSHTCVQLLAKGYEPVIVDNLCNAKLEVLGRVAVLAGRKPTFHEGDIRDQNFLDEVFAAEKPVAVIHFAGLKAVAESVEKPLEYYDNNVNGSLVLTRSMQKAGVKNIIFSSSATVYGDPASVPITESFPVGATSNPYGRSKYIVECCLGDLQAADKDWSVTLLRYFNPVGAHPSGTIGEDPRDIPNNLMPYISQVAVGKREQLSVFGNDYPTPDGTGVRDYIHVMDLADGHVAALEKLTGTAGVHTYNLGTGCGSSVLEMVGAFEKASGREVPYQMAPRRAGDIAECWAATDKAEKELGWRAQRTVAEMAADAWRWQSGNPDGYR